MAATPPTNDPEHHEQGLARFLVGEWRARFRESLAPSKRRDLERSQLPHVTHLDARFAKPIPLDEQSAAAIGALLREKGAEERCYLLSEDPALDRRELPLDEALAEVVDGGSAFATFVSCVPAKLAYFHEEDPAHRYLLELPS